MPDLAHWLMTGSALSERGNHAGAVTAFVHAREFAPHDVSLAMLLANAHRLAGDLPQERAVLVDAFAHSAAIDASQQFALGAALLGAVAAAEAEECFARVLRTHPRDPAVLAAIAGARRTRGLVNDAWPFAERALAGAPTDPAVLLTAATIRHELGDVTGAFDLLDQAERVRPGHAPTQLQRAYTTLITGASDEGWRLFESRSLPAPNTRARAWHGELATGESILVTAEQGVGDQFQFVRFVAALAARGFSRIVVQCNSGVLPVLAQNGFDVVERGAAPDTDWHVPLMSLPHRLGLGGDVMGTAVPYLHTPHQNSQRPAREAFVWKSPPTALRLGVVWAGNPAFMGTLTRDFDPALLSMLAAIPNVSWLSLQQGAADATLPDAFHRLPPLADWAETAEVLSQLDGLVTVDTGIAHLAGAMGIRTWLLLKAVPDWRWGLRGKSTPWYPTMTLLRQPAWGDWPAVIEQLAGDLAETTRG